MQERIGPYLVVGRLGAGGMGLVERVRQVETGQEYALKRLSRVGASDPVERERFVREARALASLSHPHVVGIHSAELEGPSPYFVQPLLAGGSLAERLRGGPLPIEEARRIGQELAAGLAHAHERGVLHRDLKPENVLFDGEGRAQLVDFGLASTRAAESLTATGAVMGTPAYMAPEQAQDASRVDERADVYALGAVLFAMLTGRPPLVPTGSLLAFLARVQSEAPPSPQRLRPEVPLPLAAACERALAKDPAQRWASAAELERALGRSPARATRWPWLAWAAGSSLTFAALALYGLWGASGAPRSSEAPRSTRSPSASPSAGAVAEGPTPSPGEGATPAPLRPLRLLALLPEELAGSHPRAGFRGDEVVIWRGDAITGWREGGEGPVHVRVPGDHGRGSVLRAGPAGVFFGTTRWVQRWLQVGKRSRLSGLPSPQGFFNAGLSPSHLFLAGPEGLSAYRLVAKPKPEQVDPAPGSPVSVIPLPGERAFLACGTEGELGWIARWRREGAAWRRADVLPMPSHVRSLALSEEWIFAGDGVGRIHRLPRQGPLRCDEPPYLALAEHVGLGLGLPVRGLVVLGDALLAVSGEKSLGEGAVTLRLKAWRLPGREPLLEETQVGAALDGCLNRHAGGRSALLSSDRQVYLIRER